MDNQLDEHVSAIKRLMQRNPDLTRNEAIQFLAVHQLEEISYRLGELNLTLSALDFVVPSD